MGVKVKKEGSGGRTVVHSLVIKPPQRKVYDIGTWRSAIKSADTGRVRNLFDLFEDLYLDGTLFDAVDKRISAVTNSELTFQDDKGEDVEDITGLIDTPEWEDLLTIIMKARFWGRSGMEFDFSSGFSVREIPGKHINLEEGIILIDESDTTGIPYAQDDHLLILGKPRDFGIFIRTAPLIIWKRGGFGDYAQWLELFAMPQRIGKYSAYDPESRKLLIEALDAAGSASYAVVPKETDIEIVPSSAGGNGGDAYNTFRQACNEETLITVLGQTLTTVQGEKGARSLGDIHKQVEESKNRSDMRYVQRVLNLFVLPALEKRGFPVSGGRFVFPRAAEALTVSDVVQLAAIMDIPVSYLNEKYSIPAPKNGEPVAGRDQARQDPDPDPDPGSEPDPKKIKHADRNFFLRLYDFFVHAPATPTGALTGNRLTLNDSDLNNRILDRVIDGQITFDPELFEYFSRDFIRALDTHPTQLADLGIGYNYESDAFRTAQELNIFHFSAAKTLAELTELNRIFRESGSYSEFYAKSQTVVEKFNRTWQRTEWETAVLISESHQNYHRLKEKTKRFPYWEYSTVGDSKVRPEHEALAGVILPVNDPRWDKIWPPNGWKCRCSITPRMAYECNGVDIDAMRNRVDEYLNSTEWAMGEAQGFGVNRALLPELFTSDQMYVKKFPTMAHKLLKDVNYQTYRLGSYEQCRAKATKDIEPYTGTPTDFFKPLLSKNNKIFFTDYNGRSVLFDETLYKKGRDEEKYAFRAPYLKAVTETLRTPNEVWVSDFKGDRFNKYLFIKHYKNETLAVIAGLKYGTVYRIKTWFPIDEKETGKYDYRHGLLIKQNPIE